MADFSRSDIEEAKKRVREMQMRANSYIGADNSAHKQNFGNNAGKAKPSEKQKQNVSHKPERNFEEDKQKTDKDDNNSDSDSFIILMLLLLLSHEGADRKLLLALLYLLL